jgi:NAD(P)-dependent dehydrogenase (short-subunit alcohol dehydrogenase family)
MTPSTAIITGAASGIGRACVLRCVEQGTRVAAMDRELSALEKGLADVRARVSLLAVDVSDRAACQAGVAKAVASLGHVDALIHFAGIWSGTQWQTSQEPEWDSILAVNLKGSFFMAQQVGRHLIAGRRPGCIVSLASTHGLVGYPQRAAYGIAKAGIIQMTRMLAIEWAEHGIRVNAVAPGTIDTPSRAEYFSAHPEARKAMTERIPVHRFGTSDEVAGLVRYLAGPEAAYITGQTLVLDGGLTSY